MKYWEQETSVLLQPGMAAADSLSIGVWMRILNYCAIQENGGRIDNAAVTLATDRALISTLGITREELRHALENSTIVFLDGTDLCIKNYCHREQTTLEARRVGGKKGGRPPSETSSKPPVNLPATEVIDPETPPSREREGKVRKEKERNSFAPEREEFVSSDSEFHNAANRGDAAADIARSYPANGSEHRAAAAIVRVLASGTLTEDELRAKVARHAKCWHALPPRLRNFCPGRAAYFEESRFNDDPKLGPWIDPDHSSQADEAEKKSGAPPVPERKGLPAPADWSALYAEEMDLPASAVPHSWSLVPADVQRRIVAAAERRAAA